MKRLLFAIALFCNCATLFPKGETLATDGVERAVWSIWAETFGRNDRPPRVLWITGDRLNCTQSTGWTGFKTVAGCRGGWTVTPFEVYVSLHDAEPLSDTPLAHELEHAKQVRDGILDPLHKTPEFRALGECNAESRPHCGEVETANATLKALSL